MISFPERIAITLKRIVNLLISGRYDELERLSKGVRLTAEHIKQAVLKYGDKLAMPPASAFDKIDSILIIDSSPKRWSIRFDLWTEEEKRSDLSIECTFIETSDSDGMLEFEIDNLHVL